MSVRRPSLTVAGALVIVACTTDYQQGKDDPSFGGPNALAGQRPPGPTLDTSDGGGAVGSSPQCVTAGGTLADGGSCGVSFSKDVIPSFAAAGCATVSCHGGATRPRIDPANPPATWQTFQAFTLSNGKPYINPCSTDSALSTLGCNLIAEGQPGACGVHMPIGAQIPQAALDKVNAWLKCGSPSN